MSFSRVAMGIGQRECVKNAANGGGVGGGEFWVGVAMSAVFVGAGVCGSLRRGTVGACDGENSASIISVLFATMMISVMACVDVER